LSRFFLLAILLPVQLWAAEYRPYPEAQISVEQWQEYFDAVLLEFAETMQAMPEVDLILFYDESTLSYYAFTSPGNPAHPAWATRKVVEQDGAISVEQIGYFAGEEAPFADLFDAFSDLSDEMRKEFEQTLSPDESSN
jgi:hypothetical protein